VTVSRLAWASRLHARSSRRRQRGRTARDLTKRARPSPSGQPIGRSCEMDFRFTQQRAQGDERVIGAQPNPSYVLIRERGVMACPQGKTRTGSERSRNESPGHFVFVNRLVPLLKAGAPNRHALFRLVTKISDVRHRGSEFRAGLLYQAIHCIRRSKRQIFCTRWLSTTGSRARRARDLNHPGGESRTELARHLTP